MDILDSFKTIMQCAIFCKSPVGNTFVINNADEKYIEYLLGDKEDGIIDLREVLYYWIMCLIIGYTLRGVIALSNNEQFINLF